MKTFRNASLGILLSLVFASTFAAGVARADDADDADDVRSDARVISARAGRVNFVSGDVRLRRAGSLEWRALTADDELKSGDTVNTGHGGRVEILLNPGSYFRAGAGAEFTLAEADLDELRLELARGSAVVEATGYSDTELSIVVATPRTTVSVVRTGIYRFNALPDGTAEVGVFKGRVLFDATMVKDGKSARAGAGGVEVTKLDKKNRDELDLWSRDRGKELAKANEKLQHRALQTAFARNSFENIFGSYGYGNGLWFYNDRLRCYTFLPFSYGWTSPYGYGYWTGVVPHSYPSRHWPQRTNPQTGQSGWPRPSDGGGGGSTGGGGATGGGGVRPQLPPQPSGPPAGSPGRTIPSFGDSPVRSPRMERSPSDGQPRRDNH